MLQHCVSVTSMYMHVTNIHCHVVVFTLCNCVQVRMHMYQAGRLHLMLYHT